MFLTEKLDDTITYQGITFHLDMSFDNILHLTEVLDAEDLDEFERVVIALENLITNEEELKELSFEEQHMLLMAILRDKLGFISDLEENTSEQDLSDDSAPRKKEYDYAVDGERIYASFLMDYGIDLLDMQGKLHWKKFLALLGGLSERTPFMQVVKIRTQEIPPPNKHNTKERNQIMELQRKYALEQPDLQDGLAQAATFLRRHAKVGDKNG